MRFLYCKPIYIGIQEMLKRDRMKVAFYGRFESLLKKYVIVE